MYAVMGVLLQVENISKRFGGIVALSNVSFTINVREIVGLIGENGSGKSTLVKIISGVYRPDSGVIIVDGKAHKFMTPIQAIRAGISVIYQDFLLCPNLTVAENIAMGSWAYKRRKLLKWGELYRSAEQTLKRIGAPIDVKAEVAQLSAAEKQIVAIARALFEGARLIIMDEPTSALTEKEINVLFDILRRLKEENVSIVFVSHKLQEIEQITDRIIILRDGQVVYDGLTSVTDVETMQFYMTGERFFAKEEMADTSRKGFPPLLVIEDLTLKPYFYNISFSLFEGEVLGVTGLLGSGRRELALALIGALRPESGRIYLQGKVVHLVSPGSAWNSGIAYVPEDRITEGLILPQTITANIILPSIKRYQSLLSSFFYRRTIPVGQRWCQELKIKAPSSEVPVATLSGGNQQRVVLAKCLESNPRILLLNNPTMGIDVKSKAFVHSAVRQLAGQGLGVVIFSDDIPELRSVCDRIIILRNGRIAYEVEARTIQSDQQLYKMLIGE